MIWKKGLARTTFLFSFLLMAMVLTLSMAVLYFAMPGYYLYTKEQALENGMDQLATELAVLDEESGAELVTAFAVDFNANLFAFDVEGRMVPALSSPFISIAQLPDTNIEYGEVGGAEGIYELYITSNSLSVNSGNEGTEKDAANIRIVLEDQPFQSSTVIESFSVTSELDQAVISTERAVNSEHVKHISVTSTLQPIDEAQGVILSLLPWLLLTSALVALGLSWVFSRQLTGPILKISNAAVRMQAMEPDVASAVRTGDELGELSTNLDTMYTSLRETIHSLRDETERAGRLERSKTEFMQSAGHELKTPIAALGGIVEGMIDNVGIYRDRDTYLVECQRQIDTLAGLVGKILQASKADLPDEELVFENIDLKALLEKQIEEQALFIHEKKLDIRLDGQIGTVFCDENLLIQVLRNLLSNAIRYTAAGEAVKITGKQIDGAQCLEVWNACEPIPSEDIQKLTMPFYTRSFSRDKARSGTGLGLYIVHKNLDRLGILMDIRWEDGGLLFALHFPPES